jgi:protein-S-isoprenylcysteine O-methyltransferase Ste14
MTLQQRRRLDRFEQIAVVIAYIFLVIRVWPSEFLVANITPILLLISEGTVVVFLILRRPTDEISVRPFDWIIAAGGTFLVLLVGKGGDPVSVQIAFFFITYGIAVNIFGKLSLRRSFGLVAANRGIKQHGMYAFVRHPIYAGYMLTHIGYLLFAPSWTNFLVYAGAWFFFVLRIFAEEKILLEDKVYQSYSGNVRYRLIPLVF